MFDAAKNVIKRFPGARWLYRSLVRTPGGWIFTRRNLGWLREAAIASRLPWPFRFFVAYSGLAPAVKGIVFGSEHVHGLASGLTRAFGCTDELRVDVGALCAYVWLRDPRSLLIPGEIARSAEIRLLRELLHEGDTFVDIGANHGSFSIVASDRVGRDGLVIAIEPQPKLARLVERSLRENGRSPFQVHQVACSNVEGTAEFYVPRATSGSAGLYRAFSAISAGQRYPVCLRRFDDAVDWERFPGTCVVKIDVEGAEVEALEGASAAIGRHRPPIFLEINPHSMQGAGRSVQDLVAALRGLGYSEFREIGDPVRKPLDSLADRQRNVVVFADARA